ncbi:MAG: nuclear transport factor 2 family protein [Pseudomonadota bacterium]
MNTQEIGTELVRLCNAGDEDAVVDRYYSPAIVSIEGQGSEEMPARIEGIDGVRQKAQWWYANNTVHSTRASGPYLGAAPDQFLVRFEMDLTPNGGERLQMDEVAVYRVADGKIVEEAFYYSMG